MLLLKKPTQSLLRKAREERKTKRLLIVDGWKIAIDDDHANSLNSKINNFKNSIGLLNDDCGGIINDSDSCFVAKSNTCDRNLTLRLKGLGKRQVEKVGFVEVVSYFFIFIINYVIMVVLKHVKFFVYL